MNTKEMNEARAEVVNHLGEFIARLSYALRDFVTPLDPTEGPDEMAYIRRVMDAVDNVVLVALRRCEKMTNRPLKRLKNPPIS